MKPVIKRLPQGLFSPPSDYRIRLFYILAVGGIAISLLTIAMSIVTNMWATALLAAVLVVFSLGLIVYTQRTGRFQTAYILTVTVIFVLFLPMMFFTSGGHRSGMPSIFLLAVLFTVLMIKGRAALFISLLEIVEYSAICIFAYYNPEYVTHYETERQILTDTIFAFACVSLVCGTVLYYHLKEYDRQRELLHEQNEKLKRYDASRSVFLTTVSHEVKNPLNAINLHARDTIELMDEDPIDAAMIKGNQQVIEKMVARIDRILTDLKDTVAIEQGRLSLSLAPMRLDRLLGEVLEIYHRKNDTGGNELILDVREELPPISADYARIVQVVTNLLSNAVKHTQRGRIVVSLYRQGGEQIVVVADNGEGMKEEIRERVFKGYVSSDKEYWRHGICSPPTSTPISTPLTPTLKTPWK